MKNKKFYVFITMGLLMNPISAEEIQQHEMTPLQPIEFKTEDQIEQTDQIQEDEIEQNDKVQEDEIEQNDKVQTDLIDIVNRVNNSEGALELEKVFSLKELNYFEEVQMGSIERGNTNLVVDGQNYPLYYTQYTNFVSSSTLKQIGFEIIETEDSVFIKKSSGKVAPANEDIHLNSEIKLDEQLAIIMNEKRTYVGNCLTYSFKSGEEYLVPVRSLLDYYNLSVRDDHCYLSEVNHSTTDYVDFKGSQIENITNQMLEVELTSLYINTLGDEEIMTQYITLNPNEMLDVNYTELGFLQPSSLVTKVTVINQEGVKDLLSSRFSTYGQGSNVWKVRYTQGQLLGDQEFLESLFPESKVIGVMKYDFNGFTKDEIVEVAKAQQGYSYYIKYGDREIRVPWNSVEIPNNPQVNTVRATDAELETYVNRIGITSETDYFVWTDISRQRTYVFKKQEDQWTLYRDMICTTGNNTTPTPRGTFALKAYVPYFGLNKGYRCQDAIQIFGDYLYHSVMLDTSGSYVLESNGPLGQQGSAGCIRLSVEDAEWFYETLPLKTEVWIN